MLERYSRQILFQRIGEAGQREIREKHVLIVGVGALGTSIAEMLVRSGVGKVTIIDRDYVEVTNLQRQHLYTEEDAVQKWPKAKAAEERLRAVNRDVAIDAIVGEADVPLLESLATEVDVIMDGTDNFETRFIINDIAQKYQLPYIFGSCVGSFGATFTIVPGKTPCLHCLLKQLPMKGQTCDTVGIISPTVQMVTAYQTAEALKILSKQYEALRNTYVAFDLWENDWMAIKASPLKDSNCLSCGDDPTYPFLTPEAQTKVAVLCGRETVQIRPAFKGVISLEQLASDWKRAGYDVSSNPFLLSVRTEDQRMVVFQDGRALVHGTNDAVMARKLYDSLLG